MSSASPKWKRSERTRNLARWNELLSGHIDAECAERLANHLAFEGPDADFMRARAARRRGDIGAARTLIGTCLERLPGNQEFAEFAEENADACEALERLAGDPDVLVRAAAFKAAGALGCPPPLDTLAARVLRRTATAWEVRAGAAQALAAARPAVAVGPLVTAVSDPHANVRKAAVTALAPMHAYPGAVEALQAAASDGDADVRAYARHAVDGYAAKAGSS